MKSRFAPWIACLLAVLMLFGCGAGSANTTALTNPEVTPTAVPEEAPIVGGLPNPVVEVGSYADLLKAVPGVMLSNAPANAQNVTYCYINGDPVIAQIEFVVNNNEYTYRAAAAKVDAQSDISGVYDDLSKTAELTSEGNITAGGQYTLRYAPGETKGLATWYYAPTGCQYSLFTPTGCDISQEIEEVVDELLPITTDANGNPLNGLSNTPIPAIEEGKISGKVIEIHDNDIIINTANGNTLQILLTHISTVTAKVGDTVEIVYSGNIIDAPEALTITVTQAAPAALEIHGKVMQYSTSSVFIQTTTVNTFGFVINSDTKFTGKSKALKAGNTVTITYTGDLTNAPVATTIETTAVSVDPEPTAKPADDPVNKSLKGTVSCLTSKRVTINTDSGHTYTFQRDGSTVITGNYNLEVGCRIRVRYDGYASKGPHAKQIDVLAPPDPTPPSPVTRTISGTVTMQAGNALVVLSDSGRQYSFLLGGPEIIGSGGEGDRVKVTFTDDGYGNYNVTRLVYEMPIIYMEPGPELEDNPEVANPALMTGNTFGG